MQKLSNRISSVLSFTILIPFFAGCANDELTKGPDIYLAGQEGRDAKYWKNGIGVALT